MGPRVRGDDFEWVSRHHGNAVQNQMRRLFEITNLMVRARQRRAS